MARPKVVVISDTPSFRSTIRPVIEEFAEVIILGANFKYNIQILQFTELTPEIAVPASLNLSTLKLSPQVLQFDYELFRGNLSLENSQTHILDFRIKDWGPASRWVAFVDFFLASRAKHAVISGAHRRVGTTYVQLIAALAAAHNLGISSPSHLILVLNCY